MERHQVDHIVPTQISEISFAAHVHRCRCGDPLSHAREQRPCPLAESSDLGVIAYWSKSLLKRWAWELRKHWIQITAALGFALLMLALFPHGAGMGLFVIGATVLTNVGTAIVTNRMTGAGTEPVYIGWGTGAGTAVVTDTTLFTEKDVDLSTGTGTRTTGSSSRVTTTVTNDTYQVAGTRTATGAGTVTNAGLWDNATMGSGVLFVKGDFTGIGLAIGDAITFTVKTKFVAG
jgi:hypothetical protein